MGALLHCVAHVSYVQWGFNTLCPKHVSHVEWGLNTRYPEYDSYGGVALGTTTFKIRHWVSHEARGAALFIVNMPWKRLFRNMRTLKQQLKHQGNDEHAL